MSSRSLIKYFFNFLSNSDFFRVILICSSGKSCQILGKSKRGKTSSPARFECIGLNWSRFRSWISFSPISFPAGEKYVIVGGWSVFYDYWKIQKRLELNLFLMFFHSWQKGGKFKFVKSSFSPAVKYFMAGEWSDFLADKFNCQTWNGTNSFSPSLSHLLLISFPSSFPSFFFVMPSPRKIFI